LRCLKDEQSPRDADMDALIKVLQDAVLAAENMDLHVWSANTGRRNIWHSGWRLMGWKYYKVFKNARLEPIATAEEFARARLFMRKAHAAGLVLCTLHRKAVGSLSDYHSTAKHAMGKLK